MVPYPAEILGAIASGLLGMKRRLRRKISLRDFDLKRRLKRYPCSYMIYTEAFDALPGGIKDAVYRRMWKFLSAGENGGWSRARREAAIGILRRTKPDLPDCFQPAIR